MAWTQVGKVADLGPGTMKSVTADGHTLLLANVEGTVYALDGLCSHRQGVLADGQLEGYAVRCPRHGAQFDVRTGKVVSNVRIPLIGKAVDQKTYPARVDGEDILVDL